MLLCEQGDLAGYTSSASTKLIHGGLRYLEYYEFRLVREALIERERLLEAAPHIIWPLRFILPHEKGIRPAWFVRLGLFLYDHLAPRKRLPGDRDDPPSRAIRPGRPLKPGFDTAFVYSDCWVEDSRLVALNALDAAERGADIRVRTKLARRRAATDGVWVATLAGCGGRREPSEVRARVLVNAAGPFVADVLNTKLGLNTQQERAARQGQPHRRPEAVRGRSCVHPAEQGQAHRLRHPLSGEVHACRHDRHPRRGVPGKGRDQRRRDPVSLRCHQPLSSSARSRPADVVWTYSGVRPLFDDGSSSASAVTRDYVFDLDAPVEHAPVLSIFGGKITTFRKLAEHALES